MLRLIGLLFVVAAIGALFGPRRMRVLFVALGAAAVAYTLLRVFGIVEGPRPHDVG